MNYYVDATIYGVVKKITDPATAESEFAAYQATLQELKLYATAAELQSRGVTNDKIDDFLKQIQKLAEAESDAAMDMGEGIAKLYPEEYAAIKTPEFANKLLAIEENYHKSFYDAGRANLSAEDKTWLNNYLDQVDIARKNMAEDIAEFEIDHILDGGKPSPEFLAAVNKLPADFVDSELQAAQSVPDVQSAPTTQIQSIATPTQATEPAEIATEPNPVPATEPAQPTKTEPTPVTQPTEQPATIAEKGLSPVVAAVTDNTPIQPTSVYPEN